MTRVIIGIFIADMIADHMSNYASIVQSKPNISTKFQSKLFFFEVTVLVMLWNIRSSVKQISSWTN
jgi:hypothetical protein